MLKNKALPANTGVKGASLPCGGLGAKPPCFSLENTLTTALGGILTKGQLLGVGVDLVYLPAFAEQIDDAASSFCEGVFTHTERRVARVRSPSFPARSLAARYAAKEALIKAWSAALFQQASPLSSVDLREIEVIQDAYARPALRFHGCVAEALQALPPFRAHLSLSHDGDYAAAVVILERLEVISGRKERS